ncbi:Transcriptional adapter ADA2 [Platanthera guangdongensis]|uniref:Transcriptional adapter ADA2 n=1 Tax=Platanthera guangdongensis TaxID=2320717 RepID=A0ABR2LPW9_9ASPA
MLRSPKFHICRTRLVIYNVPKVMTQEEVKKLCIEAVISRASKQNKKIQKVKLLKDNKKEQASVKKQHSRGVAFVDFEEHEHALVALRVLNNNPTAGSRTASKLGTGKAPRVKIRKRKLEEVTHAKQEKMQTKQKKRKQNSAKEEVDKLDRLIEQYRSKFAGIRSSMSKDGDRSSGHKEVRRWTEVYGLGNWAEVAEHVGTKNKEQCINHYTASF